jgi:superfamily II DNA helicase RecQ
MPTHFFAIPALDPGAAQQEFNSFCASHRVAGVERVLVSDGPRSFWALAVSTLAGPGPLPGELKQPPGKAAPRVDYKELLNEADFERFAALRNWRKQVADRDGVAIYHVFSNEQLAAAVTQRADSLAALAQIDGIGPARLERYGAALLAELVSATAGPADAPPAHRTG